MSATPSPVRILIADDHPVVRAGLISMIEADPADNMTIVGQAKDGQEALELFEKLRPEARQIRWAQMRPCQSG